MYICLIAVSTLKNKAGKVLRVARFRERKLNDKGFSEKVAFVQRLAKN